MKLSDFITTNGITLHSNECAYNRYLQGYWPPHSLHWACRLYCGATKKRMNVTITHGPLVKHAPILLDVLDSLAVETGLLAESEAFLKEVGVARETLERQEARLRNWLGDELTNELLTTEI